VLAVDGHAHDAHLLFDLLLRVFAAGLVRQLLGQRPFIAVRICVRMELPFVKVRATARALG
jgi:hypothetical protein